MTAVEAIDRDTLAAELRQYWTWLCRPGEVRELRALKVVRSEWPYKREHTECGYFAAEQTEQVLRVAAHYSGTADARGGKLPALVSVASCYVTLNPVAPAAAARAPARLEALDRTTSDDEVLRRRTLLVDIDATRAVAGVSATDTELALAAALRDDVLRFLTGRGWPEPLQLATGNGFAALYSIDVPTEDGGLVRSVLRALDAEFSGERGTVDTSVHNAARISRLPSTMNRGKDELTAEAAARFGTEPRPHRWARVLAVPSQRVDVPAELLQELASEAPQEQQHHNGKHHTNGRARTGGSAAAHDDIDDAVRAWNVAHPTMWPRKASPCAICGSPDGLKESRRGPEYWACFSSRHEACGVDRDHGQGVKSTEGRPCYTGDALDHAAAARQRSRVEVLREDGYLADRGSGGRGRAATQAAAAPGSANKPRILVTTHALGVGDQAVQALLEGARGRIFQRGGQLVHVVRHEQETVARGLRRPASAPVIVPMAAARLFDLLTDVADWRKFNAKGEEVHCTPPGWVAEGIMARGSWPFPALDAVSQVPFLRTDGTVCSEPGLDVASGILFEPGDSRFPAVLAEPTQAEAAAAVLRLLDVLCDFEFVSDADSSAAVAAILTAVARAAIPGAVPLFGFSAPVRGAGKSLLANVVAMIATGREAAAMTPPTDDDEMRKVLLSVGISGDGLVLFDNIATAFGSASLAAAITSGRIRGRVLGASKDVDLPLRVTWLATANNLRLRGDLGRRVVLVEQDPQLENPEDRSGFKYDPLLEHVARMRGELVAAALTVLRGHAVAGRPGHGQPKLGSFEQWDSIVRAACIWAGLPDPLATRTRIRDDADDDVAAIRELFAAWDAVFGESAATVAEAVDAARGETEAGRDLRAVLSGMGRSRDLDPKAIGKRLAAWRGRIVDGRRLMKGGQDKTRQVARWRLLPANGAQTGVHRGSPGLVSFQPRRNLDSYAVGHGVKATPVNPGQPRGDFEEGEL